MWIWYYSVLLYYIQAGCQENCHNIMSLPRNICEASCLHLVVKHKQLVRIFVSILERNLWATCVHIVRRGEKLVSILWEFYECLVSIDASYDNYESILWELYRVSCEHLVCNLWELYECLVSNLWATCECILWISSDLWTSHEQIVSRTQYFSVYFLSE